MPCNTAVQFRNLQNVHLPVHLVRVALKFTLILTHHATAKNPCGSGLTARPLWATALPAYSIAHRCHRVHQVRGHMLFYPFRKLQRCFANITTFTYAVEQVHNFTDLICWQNIFLARVKHFSCCKHTDWLADWNYIFCDLKYAISQNC